jgi:hypothetical protein
MSHAARNARQERPRSQRLSPKAVGSDPPRHDPECPPTGPSGVRAPHPRTTARRGRMPARARPSAAPSVPSSGAWPHRLRNGVGNPSRPVHNAPATTIQPTSPRENKRRRAPREVKTRRRIPAPLARCHCTSHRMRSFTPAAVPRAVRNAIRGAGAAQHRPGNLQLRRLHVSRETALSKKHLKPRLPHLRRKAHLLTQARAGPLSEKHAPYPTPRTSHGSDLRHGVRWYLDLKPSPRSRSSILAKRLPDGPEMFALSVAA